MKTFSIRSFLIHFVCAALIPIILLGITSTTKAATTTYYVNPDTGNDNANGQSSSTPFRSIQHAIDLAQPGDTIQLATGIYRQDIISQRDGTQSLPITITGPADAIITGAGNARIFELRHDYYTLQGFTIDGKHGTGSQADDYRDKLLYVIGTNPRDGVQGLRVLNMRFQNAGGECVRLRYFAQYNEIAESSFQNCGVHDYRFNAGGKNGEGIYIGTAPEQLGDGKSPTKDPDQSNNNWIHHNTFDTQGNECVDIKEAATANLVEYNDCTGQRDPNSAGFDSRGNSNIFRYNESYDNAGAGIRLGGDTASDGIHNDAYGNVLSNNATGGIRFQRDPQGLICANTVEGSEGATGSYGEKYDISAACPSDLSPTPTRTVRTPTPQATAQPTGQPTAEATPEKDKPRGCAIFRIDSSAVLIESELANQRSNRFVEMYDPSRSNGIALVSSSTGSTSQTDLAPSAYTYHVGLPIVQNGAVASIVFELALDQERDVTIWILGFGEDNSSDSFFMQLDEGKRRTANVSRNSWSWRRITSLELKAGQHRLLISERELGAAIDAIAITQADATPTQAVAAPCK